MTVAYPRKLRNAMGAREILAQVVRDREIHLITLNRYRYSEQRSCKDLTDVIERLDGEPPELVRMSRARVSTSPVASVEAGKRAAMASKPRA